MLEKITPREQSGRDSFSRFRAQVRSAAIASLSILEGKEIDRIYCDLHDDFVIRKKLGVENFVYIFYQVKTNGKKNHLWKLSEVFGINSQIKNQDKQNSEKIRDSFVGKLLLHTVEFNDSCLSVVFQTNINNNDSIDAILEDIKVGTFENKFVVEIIKRFNDLYTDKLSSALSESQIKTKLKKLSFETDVQYLKDGEENFEPIARAKIYEFSEVDLTIIETKEILLKLLKLIEDKSSGVIESLTKESIEEEAGVSVEDLLRILSISADAYYALLDGEGKTIKNASIIQRTLEKSGADKEQIEFCSRCKTKWDLWLRNNRHNIPEFDINCITQKISDLFTSLQDKSNAINISILRTPLNDLKESLNNDGILHDLDNELILGGFFSELVRKKS